MQYPGHAPCVVRWSVQASHKVNVDDIFAPSFLGQSSSIGCSPPLLAAPDVAVENRGQSVLLRRSRVRFERQHLAVGCRPHGAWGDDRVASNASCSLK